MANSLNRFAVSSWMPFRYNPDGSLDFYFQNESPGGDKEANWLPAHADHHLPRSTALCVFGLMARTGMSILLIADGFVALLPEGSFQRPLPSLLLAAMGPIAVACFVLPLRGMHLRIAAEKDQLLAATATRFEAAIRRLHQRVDDERVVDAPPLHAQLVSLAVERDALAKTSTWPWDTATLTTFVTTLVLPTVLWLLTKTLGGLGL